MRPKLMYQNSILDRFLSEKCTKPRQVTCTLKEIEILSNQLRLYQSYLI